MWAVWGRVILRPVTSHDVPQANADLIYRLRSLPIAGTVLHLGAHPDDEDSGLIAFLSLGLGLRVVYWSATRGEGGQNRLGPEREESLGIVRTWESLEAREVDGGEVLYGPFYDFGFSKSGGAALAKWGRDDVLRELVRAIRLVRPHVVVSRWSGQLADGHGHHQAVGMLAAEAFEAAGAPDRYPELRESGLRPWRAVKLYRSLGGDWQPGEGEVHGRLTPALEREGVLRIDAGTFDPVSGRTFQELASLGRNRHRSQAMAELPEPGDYFYYYELCRSRVRVEAAERSFFDGLDPTLSGLAADLAPGVQELHAALSDAQGHAQEAVRVFHPAHAEEAGEHVLLGVAFLRNAMDLVAAMSPSDGVDALGACLGRKERQFEDVAARCLGLGLECLVEPGRVVPGGRVRATVRFWSGNVGTEGGAELAIGAPDGWAVFPVSADVSEHTPRSRNQEAVFDVEVPATAELTCPYWLRERRGMHRYPWPDAGPAGLPFDGPLITGTCRLTVGRHALSISAPGVHRQRFVGGYREIPLAVLPPIALQPREGQVMLPPSAEVRKIDLQVSVRSTQDQGMEGTVSLEAPPGWKVDPPKIDVLFLPGGESRTVPFEVAIPAGLGPGVEELHYQVTTGDHRHGVVVRPVRQPAPGVPRPADETNCAAEVFVVEPADVSVRVVDVDFVRRLRCAYITGVDEEILPSLARFELDLTPLAEGQLEFADLQAFDAVVVGPNAYLLRDDVRRSAADILRYVDGGGTLIVQYQGYGYQTDGLAPYPFGYHVPHDRVTWPDAPVVVLEPGHPIMSEPNALGPADFEGWVHDRGLYFFGEWDRRYVPLIESHDPGDGPQAGGLLTASYGRGSFAYVGYSLFRQVPAGVPGAIRLFANLLGLADARIRERMELARAVGMFSFMGDDQLYEVARLMSERWFDDGDSIARQGEPGAELFLVLEGEIEILKEAEGRWTRFVARKGETVGELAILTDLPRSASFRAVGDVRVLAMRGHHFRRLLRENLDLSDGLLRLLATRLATRE